MRSIPPLNAQPLVMFQTLINQLSSLASLGPKSSLKLSPVRRIVAGHDEEGRGNIRSDDPIAPKPARGPGSEGIYGGTLWTTDAMPATDNNNNIDGAQRRITGQGLVLRQGTNLRFTDLAPGASSPMHRTSSVDYNILISGKVILVTDEGAETLVEKPGDIVIQRGNMHAWRNPSTKEWVRWVSVLIDAEPAKINGQSLPDEWLA